MNIGNHITKYKYSFEQSNDKTYIRLPMCKYIDKGYAYHTQQIIRQMTDKMISILMNKIRQI